ncbi:type VII secretion system-associated protein [Streptomyces sp. NPDC093610]|uniref:type VII secretion system-associated protein n=1 Tax=Streptomyces sp. NPDC093610 TaxID=3366048 RepID=UPI0038100DE9
MSKEIRESEKAFRASGVGGLEGVAAKREAAGSWRYAFDQAYDPDSVVPAHAIMGAWPVGPDGTPGEFLPNPGYRPSTLQGEVAEADVAPTDPVDVAMYAVATGREPEIVLLEALREATVYLPAREDGELTGYRDGEGNVYAAVLTHPVHGSLTTPQLLPVSFRELLGLLPEGTAIRINPDSAVTTTMSSTELTGLLDAADGEGAPQEPARPAGHATGETETSPPPASAPDVSVSALPGIPRKGGDPGRR